MMFPSSAPEALPRSRNAPGTGYATHPPRYPSAESKITQYCGGPRRVGFSVPLVAVGASNKVSGRRWLMSRDVVTVIGVGGMGVAIARRLAAGRSLLLADVSEASLEAAASQLVRAGHHVATHVTDVSRH